MAPRSKHSGQARCAIAMALVGSSMLVACGTNGTVEKPNDDGHEREPDDESVDAGRPSADATAGSTAGTNADANSPVGPGSQSPDAGAGELPEWSSHELELLRTLRYDPSPAPSDPSNAVADDVRARRWGQQLFFDPSLSGPLLEGDNDGGGERWDNAGRQGG